VIRFTVTVPRAVRNGQHLGGIVAENAALSRGPAVKRGKGKFRIDVRSLAITAIQVNLPGAPFPSLDVHGIRAGGSGGYQALLLQIANQGNQLLKGSGSLAVTDSSGQLVQNRRFVLDTFVPQTHIDYPVAVAGNKSLPAGRYHGTVVLHYAGHAVKRAFDFSISNKQVTQVFGARGGQQSPQHSTPLWLFALGGVALLLLGFAAATAWYRRRLAAFAGQHSASAFADQRELVGAGRRREHD
jgi:hypothetical protein